MYRVIHDPQYPHAKDRLVIGKLRSGLSSLLFETVPDAPADGKAPAAPASPQATTPASPSVAPAVKPPVAGEDEIDRGIQAKLVEAIDGAGATLYSELDDFVDMMADTIPDENVRWKKGIELLSKKGHTVLAILGDIDKCIGALEEHGRIFSRNVEQQLRDRVGSRVQSVESLTKQITEKEATLAAMQAEIDGLKQKRDTDQAAISIEQAKVERVQTRFAVVFPTVLDEVKTQRKRVEAFSK